MKSYPDRRIRLTAVILLALGLLSGASRADHWTYEGAHGPEHWGGLCATGQQQSPIDIQNAPAVSLPELQFNYSTQSLKIVDNGHTLQAIFGSGNTITVAGTTYDLVQMHFHHPS